MSNDIEEGRSVSDAQQDGGQAKPERAALSRRRFTKAGLLGAPLIMTLNSRPVLGAYQCTVSGMLSGNLSNIDPNVDQCFSQSEGVWRSASVVGQQAADGSYPDHYWPAPFTPLTRFHDYFNTLTYSYGEATFIEVMNSSTPAKKGGLGISDDQNVGMKAIGSLLNAQYFGQTYFGYDADWVINTWNTWPGSLLDLSEFFAALNHRWMDQSPHPKNGW